MDSKPTIIYVSGAPGSGKTTLVKILSDQLYIPYISSDLVHGGIALTNPDHDRRKTLHNVFVPIMIDFAKRNLNFITDHVLQKGVSETDIIDRLRPYADIIYIHCKATNPIERYRIRTQSSMLPSIVQRREHLLSLAKPHANNLSKTSKSLDLGVPTITVYTDEDYSPSIDDIVSFIKTHLQ